MYMRPCRQCKGEMGYRGGIPACTACGMPHPGIDDSGQPITKLEMQELEAKRKPHAQPMQVAALKAAVVAPAVVTSAPVVAVVDGVVVANVAVANAAEKAPESRYDWRGHKSKGKSK